MKLTPQRTSGLILAAIALFTLGVAGILYIKVRAVPEPLDTPPTQADYQIKQVRLQEMGSGNTHWQLIADQAEVFEGEGRTLMRKVKITIQEPDRTWTVTGDEGDLLNATKDVEIRKNVVMVNTQGVRLQTETLRWQAKERRVWTTDPVTIFREGTVVTGQGLDSWMSLEQTRVKGRVRAIFSDEKEPRVSSATDRQRAK